jgi:hypothetical protein
MVEMFVNKEQQNLGYRRCVLILDQPARPLLIIRTSHNGNKIDISGPFLDEMDRFSISFGDNEEGMESDGCIRAEESSSSEDSDDVSSEDSADDSKEKTDDVDNNAANDANDTDVIEEVVNEAVDAISSNSDDEVALVQELIVIDD